MTLLELAERCEKATGPDRELDLAIAQAIRAPWQYVGEPPREIKCGAYTASLDAAMTLANGYGGEVTFFKDGTAKAFLWQPYPMAIEAKAATPALAICAAALKARAAQIVPNTPEGDG
jgi:hypothetical protein